MRVARCQPRAKGRRGVVAVLAYSAAGGEDVERVTSPGLNENGREFAVLLIRFFPCQ